MAAPISIMRAFPGGWRRTTKVKTTAKRTAMAPPTIARSTLESINSHPHFLSASLSGVAGAGTVHGRGLGDGFGGLSPAHGRAIRPSRPRRRRPGDRRVSLTHGPAPSKFQLPIDRVYDPPSLTRHVNIARGGYTASGG